MIVDILEGYVKKDRIKQKNMIYLVWKKEKDKMKNVLLIVKL